MENTWWKLFKQKYISIFCIIFDAHLFQTRPNLVKVNKANKQVFALFFRTAVSAHVFWEHYQNILKCLMYHTKNIKWAGIKNRKWGVELTMQTKLTPKDIGVNAMPNHYHYLCREDLLSILWHSGFRKNKWLTWNVQGNVWGVVLIFERNVIYMIHTVYMATNCSMNRVIYVNN